MPIKFNVEKCSSCGKKNCRAAMYVKTNVIVHDPFNLCSLLHKFFESASVKAR